MQIQLEPRRPGLERQGLRSPLLAGTFAVAMLIGGTRWASHLGVNPLYLSDLLLAAAVWNLFWGTIIAARRYPCPRAAVPFPLAAALVAGWAFTRLVFGLRIDVVALRDFMPYLYAATAVLAWVAVRRATAEGLERTRRVLMGALWFHLVWSFVVLAVFPSLPSMLPTVNAAQALHVFTPRKDIEGPLNAVLAAVVTIRLLKGEARRVPLALAAVALCWVAVMSGASRAGLLGAVTIYVFAIAAFLATNAGSHTRKQLVFALSPLIMAAILFALPSTSVGDRLLGTFDVATSASSAAQRGAAGTTDARLNAWARLTEWTVEDPGRAVYGEGFGPNVLADSHASLLLVHTLEEGETVPRSPHNYWVGTFARLGLIGLLLTAVATASLLRRAWRQRAQAAADETRFLLLGVPVALVLPASFGVILESPFGAIPFWWCIGAMLALSGPVKLPLAATRSV